MSTKNWRNLELLVEKIEKSFLSDNAIIKSPDYLLDKVTNELREVDISIRNFVGTSNLLVAIECRHRGTKQDVRWIEEIKTKHENLGANKIIAVSKNGFTSQAIIKAKFFGIELRTFEEITPEIIQSWDDQLIIETHTVYYKLINLRYCFESAIEGIQPIIDMEAWNVNPCATKILEINKQAQTTDSIIDYNELGEFLRKNPNQKEVKQTITFNGNATTQTNHGVVKVLQIDLTVSAWIEKEKLTTTDIHHYKNIISGEVHKAAYYKMGDGITQNYLIEVRGTDKE
jgi:hypothetical protein